MEPVHPSIKRIDLIAAISILEESWPAGLALKGAESAVRREAARVNVIDQMGGKASGDFVERMLRHPLNLPAAQESEEAGSLAQCRVSHDFTPLRLSA